MLCSLSRLDNEKISSIESAEKKIGKTLLAFSCRDLAPANLTEEELSLIKETEKKLGVVLVAVGS
jgi:hypothetical protein